MSRSNGFWVNPDLADLDIATLRPFEDDEASSCVSDGRFRAEKQLWNAVLIQVERELNKA